MSLFEDNREKLGKLAEAAIPGLRGNWTDAEKKLLKSIATGTKETCAGTEAQRTVRVELLEWLLTHSTPRSLLHPKGIQIRGIVVEKTLDLDSAGIDIPLRLMNCKFKSDIILQQARLQHLSLQGCKCKSIMADGVHSKGVVYLRGGFEAEGEVRLVGAMIRGQLDCSGGKFKNPATDEHPDSAALVADGIEVKDDVFLSDGFEAEGEVRLPGAVIGGQLDCSAGKFNNSATDKHPDSTALSASGIEVKGSIFLNGEFEAEGEVRLLGAVIGGQLNCSDGKFKNPATNKYPDSKALVADKVEVKGDVFLNGEFEAEGEVRLPGAVIGGDLVCSGGRFKNPATDMHPNSTALVANGIEVKGDVYLRGGFEAEGEVCLVGAVIGGSLDCTKAQFINPATSVSLRKAMALNLMNADVKRQLRLVHPIRHGWPAEVWGRVMLRHATVGQLIDSSEIWNPDGREAVPVALDGFVYGDLGLAEDVIDTKFRKRWLESGKSFGNLFAPQPYTQLANVLSQAGHESDARQIYMAREWERLNRVPMGWVDWCLGWLIGLTVGFGYRSRRAAYCLLGIWIFGCFVFWGGWQLDRFNPSLPHVYNAYYAEAQEDGSVQQKQRWGPPYKKLIEENGELKQYPKFSAIIYSIDTLLPIVNLHQEDYWMPVGGMRLYMWGHIAAGWFFTTMAVVGFTGLVRKE